MNLGILPDGSLRSRLKGDLYWKKQKLMLRSAQDLKHHNPATDHFLSKFELASSNGTVFFSSIEDIKDEHGDTATDLPRPQYSNQIQEHRLSPMAIPEYDEFIPENYISQIKNASLTVKTYHDNDRFMGLCITGVHSGWLELVWMSNPEGVTPDEIMGLIALILDRARDEKKYKGAFVELHMAPETAQMENNLRACGMRTLHVKNNLYELRVKDIVPMDGLSAAMQRHQCQVVSHAGEDVKSALEDILYEEKSPVPVAFPVPWSKCRQDLSFLYHDKASGSAGLLLVSEMSDTLVFDLLYGKTPVITAALLGHAIKASESLLSPDQKILIPIVLEATRPLVEKLAPTATREELVEAVIRF